MAQTQNEPTSVAPGPAQEEESLVVSVAEQAEVVALIRGFEHLYDGEIAEAAAQGKDTAAVIAAYRQIVTNAQLVAYIRRAHPNVIHEAERAVQEALS